MKGSSFWLIYAYFFSRLGEVKLWYQLQFWYSKLEKWQKKFDTNITTPKLLSSCGKLCMRRSSKQVLFSFDTSKSISIRSKFWQITTQKTCRLLASTIAGIQNFVQKTIGIFCRAATEYFWCARPLDLHIWGHITSPHLGKNLVLVVLPPVLS